HWNFNHFVVVEGFRGKRVYLNDPARGPRTVTEQEFDQSFTGVVMVFEPSAEFTRTGERRSLVKALGKRLSGSQIALTYVVLASLMLVIPGLLIPAFARVFIDDILNAGQTEWLMPLLI